MLVLTVNTAITHNGFYLSVPTNHVVPEKIHISSVRGHWKSQGGEGGGGGLEVRFIDSITVI